MAKTVLSITEAGQEIDRQHGQATLAIDLLSAEVVRLQTALLRERLRSTVYLETLEGTYRWATAGGHVGIACFIGAAMDVGEKQ